MADPAKSKLKKRFTVTLIDPQQGDGLSPTASSTDNGPAESPTRAAPALMANPLFTPPSNPEKPVVVREVDLDAVAPPAQPAPEKRTSVDFRFDEPAGDIRPSPADDDEADIDEELRDVLPQLVGYKTQTNRQQSARPTISSLLYGKRATVLQSLNSAPDQEEEESQEPQTDPDSLRRFGIWDGVFARCLLNIFGVIMFLRLGYVFALGGILYGVITILVSVGVTLITTLSLSAICTNGDVQGGGAYFMISRALGPQFGGIIGILFSLANAVAIAIYVVGFAEAIKDQVGTGSLLMYGVVCLSFVLILCLIGVDWVVKVQLALLGLLVICILSVVIGLLLSPNEEIGFVGLSSEQFRKNFSPRFEGDKDFAHILGIFFPAVTGIMAGANISGEIRKPGYSIPWGTIYAVVVSTAVYTLLGVLMASACEREVFNINGNLTTSRQEAIDAGINLDDDGGGLRFNFLIMTDISFWGPLIFLGIYAATLSSAIASLVGAPRILQAVAKDNIIPAIRTFKDGHGANEEPWKGYFLSFAIALVFVLIGDLNLIAPLITGFFMISYFFVNLACFLASLTNHPGWRPAFKYYNKWVSLAGGLGCLAIMFVLSWIFAIITVLLSGMLYLYLDIKDPDVSWGSAPDSLKISRALKSLHDLEKVKTHVKNYRPNYLVLCGDPEKRLPLITFANQLRKGKGIMLYGNVIVVKSVLNLKDHDTQTALEQIHHSRKENILPSLNIKGFLESVLDTKLSSGARALMQLAGTGNLKSNIVMMGYKEDWVKAELSSIEDYLEVIRYALVLRNGVQLVRNADQLPLPVIVEDTRGKKKEMWSTVHARSLSQHASKTEVGVDEDQLDDLHEVPDLELSLDATAISMKARDRCIDVWWLYDDGGLTILAPYLLRLHKYWAGCKLRILTVTVDKNVMNQHMIEIARMMQKFRIDAEPVVVEMEVDARGVPSVDDAVLASHTKLRPEFSATARKSSRTLRHAAMSKLLKENSSDTDLVYISMPIPDLETDALEYMSWLEMLSADMPPMVFVRGNHENVLTFEL